jgi:hypothetical protein
MSTAIAFRFQTAAGAARAARRMKERGLCLVESYGPYPAEEIEEALERKDLRTPAIALVGGIVGGVSAYALQYFTAVVQYPLNVGGRALHSWPAFVPVTFELTVLFSACAIVAGFLIINRFPHLHQPVFAIPDFERASDDRFYLYVESRDPRFAEVLNDDFITSLEAEEVHRVP